MEASEFTLRSRDGGLRASVTLLGASEFTSEAKGWGGGEKLCDFDGGS